MTKPRVARFLLKHGYSKDRVQRWLSYHLGRKVILKDFEDLKAKTYLALARIRPRQPFYYELFNLWANLRNFEEKP